MKKLLNPSKIVVALIVVTMLFGLRLPAVAERTGWKIEVVDPLGSGRFSSMRIDADGNAHVAYMDEIQTLLKYSFWDHSLNKWFTTTVDKSAGFCSLALDSKQYPHISYLDYGTGKLKYAHWTGSNWERRGIDLQAKEISFYTSITLDPDDHPSISFYEYFGAQDDNSIRLRIVSWNGAAWEVRTVDDTKGSGKFNSIATDSSGHTQIAYGNVKYEDASLRFGHWSGQSWQLDILEGSGRPGTSMWSVFMILDQSDRPHIAYNDVQNRVVKYATQENGKWRMETVAPLVHEGYPDRYGLALDAKGNPYISYYDAGLGKLKIAHRKDHKWISEVVDENFCGFTSSLQIHGGVIWVTYADEAGKALKCARRLLEDELDVPPTQVLHVVVP